MVKHRLKTMTAEKLGLIGMGRDGAEKEIAVDEGWEIVAVLPHSDLPLFTVVLKESARPESSP